MSKKLYFLMCFVLVLGLSGAAQATAIDDCRYNLSFELMTDPCDANSCDFRVCEHTATMDTSSLEVNDVLGWTDSGQNFAGVDVNCGHECLGEGCRDWAILPDGNVFAYISKSNHFFQVLDPAIDGNAIIAAGKKYTLTFDAAHDETPGELTLIYSLFYGDVPPATVLPLDVNQITSDSQVLTDILTPSGRGDWFYDLTLGFIATSGQPYLGKPLGIRFGAGSDWTFIDNIRLDWVWATSAFDPSPADGAEDVARDVNLSWSPGLWAADTNGHEVYFGTSWDDVNDANTSSDPNIYRGPDDVSGPDGNDRYSYDVPETLELGKTYYWRIDEVNQAFVNPGGVSPPPWLGDVWSFRVTGPATNPNPADGAENVSLFTDLSWTPGTDVNDVNGHDVYFGTGEAAVDDANQLSSEYMGRQDANDFNDLVPALELGKTYYWRIDEVNGTAGTLIKGELWSFTVENYLVVDDFDSYVDDVAIKAVWTVGHLTGNGAEVFCETSPDHVIDGNSMRYYFRNIFDLSGSEAVANISDLESGSNWTKGGVKAWALYFYGDITNLGDTSGVVGGIHQDQMYVAVEDGDDPCGTGILKYPDMNDIQEESWHEWNIEMADPCLADVNLANVAKIYIGFGGQKMGQTEMGAGKDSFYGDTVWFDDIRLYPPRCVPVFAYRAGSFDNESWDCLIDIKDLDVMARDWLVSAIGDVNAVAPSSTGLVGHWTLDDDARNPDVNDVSVNNNDGVLYNDVFKDAPATGKTNAHHTDDCAEGTGALTFDGFDDFIEIPTLDLNSNTVTISAWIKRSGEQWPFTTGIVNSFFSDPCDHNAPGTNAGIAIGSGMDFGFRDWAPWETNHELAYYWKTDANDLRNVWKDRGIPVPEAVERSWSYNFHTGLMIRDGLWSFVAVVVEPTKATVYLYDAGELRAATNYVPHFPELFNSPTRIGNHEQYKIEESPGDQRFFKGLIDDVHIYDRSLSHSEILSMALLGASGSQFLELESWRANADDDDKVDFHDYAIMANNWLKEILWLFE